LRGIAFVYLWAAPREGQHPRTMGRSRPLKGS